MKTNLLVALGLTFAAWSRPVFAQSAASTQPPTPNFKIYCRLFTISPDTAKQLGLIHEPGEPAKWPSLLSPADNAAFLKQIEKSITYLALPNLFAKSGQRALIQASQEFPYPAEFAPGPAAKELSNTLTPTKFAKQNIGLSLEVTATLVSNDVINLTIATDRTNFQGYVGYGAGKTQDAVHLADAGFKQPIFDLVKLDSSVIMHLGQTVLLGGISQLPSQKLDNASEENFPPSQIREKPGGEPALFFLTVTPQLLPPLPPNAGATAEHGANGPIEVAVAKPAPRIPALVTIVNLPGEAVPDDLWPAKGSPTPDGAMLAGVFVGESGFELGSRLKQLSGAQALAANRNRIISGKQCFSESQGPFVSSAESAAASAANADPAAKQIPNRFDLQLEVKAVQLPDDNIDLEMRTLLKTYWEAPRAPSDNGDSKFPSFYWTYYESESEADPKLTNVGTPAEIHSGDTAALMIAREGRKGPVQIVLVTAGIPKGAPVPGKPGFITSPYRPNAGYIDVRGYPSGTVIKCPYSNREIMAP